MAITVVQHKFVGPNSASANTLAITVTATGAGNLLICAPANQDDRTVSGVSDGTNSFTQFASAEGTDNVGLTRTDVWYLLSSSAGKTTITITWNGLANAFGKHGYVWEVSGFTTPAVDGANHITNGNNGTTMTGASVTTAGTTGFVVGVVQTAGQSVTANPAAANEFTSGGDINTSATGAACSLISSSAAAHNPAWSGGTNFSSSTAAIKETAAAVTLVVAVHELIVQQAVARAAVR